MGTIHNIVTATIPSTGILPGNKSNEFVKLLTADHTPWTPAERKNSLVTNVLWTCCLEQTHAAWNMYPKWERSGVEYSNKKK